MRSGQAEIGQQKRDRLAGHRAAAIGVYGERARLDLLLLDRLGDQRLGDLLASLARELRCTEVLINVCSQWARGRLDERSLRAAARRLPSSSIEELAALSTRIQGERIRQPQSPPFERTSPPWPRCN
jgi:hypothetical protein